MDLKQTYISIRGGGLGQSQCMCMLVMFYTTSIHETLYFILFVFIAIFDLSKMVFLGHVKPHLIIFLCPIMNGSPGNNALGMSAHETLGPVLVPRNTPSGVRDLRS